MTGLVWLTEPTTPTLLARDRWTGPRVESWRVEMLGLDGTPMGPLDGCQSMRLDWTSSRDIRGTGSLSWAGTVAPNWLTVMLQPWYTAAFPDGSSAEWPLGVFIPATPQAKWGDDGQALDVDVYDRLKVLVDDRVPATFGLPAGTVITDAVAAQLTAAGVTAGGMAVTGSTQALLGGVTWEAGTTRLRMVNDLLATANYDSIEADGYGQYHAAPYIEPLNRGVSWAFARDADAVWDPDYDHDRDTFDIPNRVLIVGRSTGDDLPPTATVTDEDPASPYSRVSRGRWIDRDPEQFDSDDPAVLLALARRRLAEGQRVASTVSISHWLVPGIDLGSLVTFRDPKSGLDLFGVVGARGIDLLEDGTATATARIEQVAA